MPTDRIDGLNMGVAVKAACTVASTAALTLSGVQTVDGIVVGNAGERVLERNAASAVDNGIYTARSSSWIRALDCDGRKDLLPGSLVYVDRGNAYARTLWVCNSSATSTAITVGTDALTWSQVTMTFSGVSAFVQNNLFPTVSAASARSVLGALGSTDIGAIANTFTAAQIFQSSATFLSHVLNYSTGPSSTAGPQTHLQRVSTSPIAGDSLGRVLWTANPAGFGSTYEVAALTATITSTSTSPGVRLMFETISSSTAMSSVLYVGEGTYTRGATDSGLGTFNSSAGMMRQGLEYTRGWTRTQFGPFTGTATSIMFSTGLSAAMEIEILFDSVSLSSNAPPTIRVGSSSIEAGSYRCGIFAIAFAGLTGNAMASTIGFIMAPTGNSSAASVFSGRCTLRRFSSTSQLWLSDSSIFDINPNNYWQMGNITLSGDLTSVAMESSAVSTSNVFDGGQVSFRWR